MEATRIVVFLCLLSVASQTIVTIYSQLDRPTSLGRTSTTYRSKYIQVADDFTVPTNLKWVIRRVAVLGKFHPDNSALGFVSQWKVDFFTNNYTTYHSANPNPKQVDAPATLPFASYSVLFNTDTITTDPIFDVSPPLTLEPGKYWFSAYPIMDTDNSVNVAWDVIVYNSTDYPKGSPFSLRYNSTSFGSLYVGQWITILEYDRTYECETCNDLGFSLSGWVIEVPYLENFYVQPTNVTLYVHETVDLQLFLSTNDTDGIALATINIRNPAEVVQTITLTAANLILGNSTDGLYGYNLTFTQASSPRGSWDILNITLTDSVGDYITFTQLQLAAMGLQDSIQVAGPLINTDTLPTEVVEIQSDETTLNQTIIILSAGIPFCIISIVAVLLGYKIFAKKAQVRKDAPPKELKELHNESSLPSINKNSVSLVKQDSMLSVNQDYTTYEINSNGPLNQGSPQLIYANFPPELLNVKMEQHTPQSTVYANIPTAVIQLNLK